jgi:hypothetical protein
MPTPRCPYPRVACNKLAVWLVAGTGKFRTLRQDTSKGPQPYPTLEAPEQQESRKDFVA